jgi:hypothetical protein
VTETTLPTVLPIFIMMKQILDGFVETIIKFYNPSYIDPVFWLVVCIEKVWPTKFCVLIVFLLLILIINSRVPTYCLLKSMLYFQFLFIFMIYNIYTDTYIHFVGFRRFATQITIRNIFMVIKTLKYLIFVNNITYLNIFFLNTWIY